MAVALKKRIGELLIENRLVTQEKLAEALKIQKETREKIGEILVRLGHVSQESLLELLSSELEIPILHLSRCKANPEVLALVPRKISELHCLVPVSKIGNALMIAMSDPMNVNALDDLRRITNLELRTFLAAQKDIRDVIEQFYGENVNAAFQDVIEDMATEETLELEDAVSVLTHEGTAQELLRLTQEEPIVKLTNSILSEAVRRSSSDIFIEPEEKSLRVRFRVDGLLQEGVTTSPAMHAGVVSRIKVMSNLNIAEHRLPQDGRFKIKVQAREIDFRVSVIPTYFGEKVVLRVLDRSQIVLDLDKLGFEKNPLDDLKRASLHPHGMIVTCGPTGSGKTTTLYALLRFIDRTDLNIVTVEDPVEYQLPGVNQVSIRPEVNLTFASALRSILRQDPDIIMVGEIRDSETADIAIKAALTGHLVLSTLHTNTAAGSVTRLLNMGIEPYLITSSVLLAGSQRLVRRICAKCRKAYEPRAELLKQIGITDKHLASKKPLFYRGEGCSSCNQTGYGGRTMLFENLRMTPSIREAILKSRPEFEIKEMGCRQGMMTLRENGIAKILNGVTTPEEVMRVTMRD